MTGKLSEKTAPAVMIQYGYRPLDRSTATTLKNYLVRGKPSDAEIRAFHQAMKSIDDDEFFNPAQVDLPETFPFLDSIRGPNDYSIGWETGLHYFAGITVTTAHLDEFHDDRTFTDLLADVRQAAANGWHSPKPFTKLSPPYNVMMALEERDLTTESGISWVERYFTDHPEKLNEAFIPEMTDTNVECDLWTPLMNRAVADDRPGVERLLDLGADWRVTAPCGKTALDVAEGDAADFLQALHDESVMLMHEPTLEDTPATRPSP